MALFIISLAKLSSYIMVIYKILNYFNYRYITHLNDEGVTLSHPLVHDYLFIYMLCGEMWFEWFRGFYCSQHYNGCNHTPNSLTLFYSNCLIDTCVLRQTHALPRSG